MVNAKRLFSHRFFLPTVAFTVTTILSITTLVLLSQQDSDISSTRSDVSRLSKTDGVMISRLSRLEGLSEKTIYREDIANLTSLMAQAAALAGQPGVVQMLGLNTSLSNLNRSFSDQLMSFNATLTTLLGVAAKHDVLNNQVSLLAMTLFDATKKMNDSLQLVQSDLSGKASQSSLSTTMSRVSAVEGRLNAMPNYAGDVSTLYNAIERLISSDSAQETKLTNLGTQSTALSAQQTTTTALVGVLNTENGDLIARVAELTASTNLLRARVDALNTNLPPTLPQSSSTAPVGQSSSSSSNPYSSSSTGVQASSSSSATSTLVSSSSSSSSTAPPLPQLLIYPKLVPSLSTNSSFAGTTYHESPSFRVLLQDGLRAGRDGYFIGDSTVCGLWSKSLKRVGSPSFVSLARSQLGITLPGYIQCDSSTGNSLIDPYFPNSAYVPYYNVDRNVSNPGGRTDSFSEGVSLWTDYYQASTRVNNYGYYAGVGGPVKCTSTSGIVGNLTYGPFSVSVEAKVSVVYYHSRGPGHADVTAYICDEATGFSPDCSSYWVTTIDSASANHITTDQYGQRSVVGAARTVAYTLSPLTSTQRLFLRIHQITGDFSMAGVFISPSGHSLNTMCTGGLSMKGLVADRFYDGWSFNETLGQRDPGVLRARAYTVVMLGINDIDSDDFAKRGGWLAGNSTTPIIFVVPPVRFPLSSRVPYMTALRTKLGAMSTTSTAPFAMIDFTSVSDSNLLLWKYFGYQGNNGAGSNTGGDGISPSDQGHMALFEIIYSFIYRGV